MCYVFSTQKPKGWLRYLNTLAHPLHSDDPSMTYKNEVPSITLTVLTKSIVNLFFINTFRLFRHIAWLMTNTVKRQDV